MSREDELSQLQARGIASAAEVFDRLAAEIGGPADPAGPPGPDPVGEQQLRAAGARLIDLFAGLFQDGVEAYLELAQSIVQARPGAGADGADPGLMLRGAPGARAATTVWIHSAPDQPLAELVPRVGALQQASGEVVDGERAQFVPAALVVGDGASASAILTLTIPPGAAAGVYFGHVLVAGRPPAAIGLRLVVEDPAS